MSSAHRHGGDHEAGLIVRVAPLGQAEWLCRRMVKRVHLANGALELEADPVWARAIDTVLAKKGVMVSVLRRAT